MAENVERVWKLARTDRWLILQMTAEELNIDEIVKKILAENLGVRKVSAELVAQILPDDQQQW